MDPRAEARELFEESEREGGAKVSLIMVRQYDEETAAINAMRGMLEDENNNRRAQMMKAIQEENQRLAFEKKQREEEDRDWNHAMNT